MPTLASHPRQGEGAHAPHPLNEPPQNIEPKLVRMVQPLGDGCDLSAGVVLPRWASNRAGNDADAPLSQAAVPAPLTYTTTRHTVLKLVLRAGWKSPPAVICFGRKPASASPGGEGQQTRCNSGADGNSPDERE